MESAMKSERKILAGLVLLVVVVLGVGGCKNKEQEALNRQIQDQINLIDKQITEIDQHQEAMKQMVTEMQKQVTAMQAELDQQAPRIHAANESVGFLKQLTTRGFGENMNNWSLLNSGISWTLIIFVLLLWLFYRLRARSLAKE